MSTTLVEDLDSIKTSEDKLVANKVARFAYTAEAYARDEADGQSTYDPDRGQNIPLGTAEIMKVNQTVIDRGYRAQASSITRMLMNHFLGRISYNLNKVNDNVSRLLTSLKNNLGAPDGIATLDSNGRLPFSQLPESAIEFKGTWDASTNTPTLANGTGTKGDFYICSTDGTVNLGDGDIVFSINDRVIYDGTKWVQLKSGSKLFKHFITLNFKGVEDNGYEIAVYSNFEVMTTSNIPYTQENIIDAIAGKATLCTGAWFVTREDLPHRGFCRTINVGEDKSFKMTLSNISGNRIIPTHYATSITSFNYFEDTVYPIS